MSKDSVLLFGHQGPPKIRSFSFLVFIGLLVASAFYLLILTLSLVRSKILLLSLKSKTKIKKSSL